MYKLMALILLFISNASYGSENAVSEIEGKLNKNIVSIHDLSKYLNKYKYRHGPPDNTFYSLDSYTNDSILPQFVIRLSFYKNKLFSIVTTYSIKSLKIISKRKAGSHYIYYLIDNTKLIKEYEEKFLKGITWAG